MNKARRQKLEFLHDISTGQIPISSLKERHYLMICKSSDEVKYFIEGEPVEGGFFFNDMFRNLTNEIKFDIQHPTSHE